MMTRNVSESCFFEIIFALIEKEVHFQLKFRLGAGAGVREFGYFMEWHLFTTVEFWCFGDGWCRYQNRQVPREVKVLYFASSIFLYEMYLWHNDLCFYVVRKEEEIGPILNDMYVCVFINHVSPVVSFLMIPEPFLGMDENKLPIFAKVRL